MKRDDDEDDDAMQGGKFNVVFLSCIIKESKNELKVSCNSFTLHNNKRRNFGILKFILYISL